MEFDVYFSKFVLPCLILCACFCNVNVDASSGDESRYFRQCVARFESAVCRNQSQSSEMAQKQPWALWLTMWSCEDEFKYHCMWATVNEFLGHGDTYVPQFYGKWPFFRFLGMQEPASAIFSVLNGVSFYVSWKRFRRKVSRNSPTFYVWNFYALVSMKAWFWSTLFHTRDMQLTELLDYCCANFGVLSSFFGLCARVFYKRPAVVKLLGVICIFFYVRHVHYLTFVHFDYGYNMKASITVGLLNSVGWLIWCILQFRKGQIYVWRCLAVVILVDMLLLLELGDFPPIWWTFDAHSLWHLGTVPLPFLWFSFLIDDSKYMLRIEEKYKC